MLLSLISRRHAIYCHKKHSGYKTVVLLQLVSKYVYVPVYEEFIHNLYTEFISYKITYTHI